MGVKIADWIMELKGQATYSVAYSNLDYWKYLKLG